MKASAIFPTFVKLQQLEADGEASELVVNGEHIVSIEDLGHDRKLVMLSGESYRVLDEAADIIKQLYAQILNLTKALEADIAEGEAAEPGEEQI